MSELMVMVGTGDIVSFLEELTEQARRGDFEGVAVATLERGGKMGAGLSFKEDAEHLFSRTLGAVANLQHAIITGRLMFDL